MKLLKRLLKQKKLQAESWMQLQLVWQDGETPLFGGETAEAQLSVSASELNNAPDAASDRLFRVLGEQFLLPERELR